MRSGPKNILRLIRLLLLVPSSGCEGFLLDSRPRDECVSPVAKLAPHLMPWDGGVAVRAEEDRCTKPLKLSSRLDLPADF